MTDADRFRRLGTYRTPRVRVGSVLSCEARDCDVIVTGYTDGRIPWPAGRWPRLAAKAMIVFGDLARAGRTKSNQAVCYRFGIAPQTVRKWRKAQGVRLSNAGTYRLRSDYQQEPWAKRARKKMYATARDSERRRKIAEVKRGKPRPPHIIEAMRNGPTGKPQSEEARAKMRAARARRWTRAPCRRSECHGFAHLEVGGGWRCGGDRPRGPAGDGARDDGERVVSDNAARHRGRPPGAAHEAVRENSAVGRPGRSRGLEPVLARFGQTR